MKNYHVVAIVLIAGFIAGCAVPAHASEKLVSSIVCVDRSSPDDLASVRGFNVVEDSQGFGWLVELKANPAHKALIESGRYAFAGKKDKGDVAMLMYTTRLKGMPLRSPSENVAIYANTKTDAVEIKHFSNKGDDHTSQTADYSCEFSS